MYYIPDYFLEHGLLHRTGSVNDYVQLLITLINDHTGSHLSNECMGSAVVQFFNALSDDVKKNITRDFKAALQSGKYDIIETVKRLSKNLLLQRLGSDRQQINVLIAILAAHSALLMKLCAQGGINYQDEMTSILKDRDIDLSVDELSKNANFLNNFLYHDMKALKASLRDISHTDQSALQAASDNAYSVMADWLNAAQNRQR